MRESYPTIFRPFEVFFILVSVHDKRYGSAAGAAAGAAARAAAGVAAGGAASASAAAAAACAIKMRYLSVR